MPMQFVVMTDGDDLSNFLILPLAFHKIIMGWGYKK